MFLKGTLFAGLFVKRRDSKGVHFNDTRWIFPVGCETTRSRPSSFDQKGHLRVGLEEAGVGVYCWYSLWGQWDLVRLQFSF